MGILGAILLVVAVILTFTLPEEDVVTPQFRVSFQEHQGEQFGTQSSSGPVPEGGSVDFVYDIPEDNVFRIAFTVAFEDDEPASDPDRFTVQLLDPNGNVAGPDAVLTLKPPRQEKPEDIPADPTPDQRFVSERMEFVVQVDVVERPKDTLVPADHPQESVDEAADRLLPSYHFPTAGAWTVRLSLDQAGDCPQPDGNPDTNIRVQECMRQTGPSGQDLGNSVTVTKLDTFYYTAAIEPLGP